MIARAKSWLIKSEFWVALTAVSLSIAMVTSFVRYSGKGDLFLDDFILGNRYRNSFHWNELWNFDNFGRFTSRNLYWRIGTFLFQDRAQFYYLLNVSIVILTAILLTIFLRRQKPWSVACVIGSIYLISAATVDEYVWISNSQHLIAHFFIALFLVVSDRVDLVKSSHSLFLLVLVYVGLQTNLIFTVALLWPALLILGHPHETRSKEVRRFLIPVVVIVALFGLRFFQVGVEHYYSTKFDFRTLELNVNFYFHGWLMFIFWILAIGAGLFVGIRKKDALVTFLFAGSIVLFLPFAFQLFQRFSHYMNFSQLFLVAGWLIVAGEFARLPKFAFSLIATGLLVGFFIRGNEQVHAWEAAPWGLGSRKVIEEMQTIDSKMPEGPMRYCFDVENDQKVLGASATWWSTGLGGGFEWLVDESDSYELLDEDSDCDAIVSLGPTGTVLMSGNR